MPKATLADLNDAVSGTTASAVGRAAHDLRGAAGNVGALGLVILCAEVEAVERSWPDRTTDLTFWIASRSRWNSSSPQCTPSSGQP